MDSRYCVSYPVTLFSTVVCSFCTIMSRNINILLLLLMMAPNLLATEGDLKLLVNEMNLEFTNKGTHLHRNFNFFAGQILTLESNNLSGDIKMQYWDHKRNSLFSSEILNKSTGGPLFRTIMPANRHKSSLVIKHTQSNGNSTVYFITFMLAQREEAGPVVRVNGLTLYPLHKSNGISLQQNMFLYYACPKEEIRLECEVAPDCTSSSTNKNVITFTMDRSTVKTCDNGATITFSSKTNSISTCITGLPTKYVLYEYAAPQVKHGTEWIVRYQYEDNETLNLICVNKGTSDFAWRTQQSTISKVFRRFHEYSYTDLEAKLQVSHNGTNISCLLNSTEAVVIELYLANKTVESDGNGPDRLCPGPHFPVGLVIGGAGFVCILILTIIIICFVCWHRKYKNVSDQTLSSNIDTDPIPDFPPRWDFTEDDSQYDDGNIMINNTIYNAVSTPISSRRGETNASDGPKTIVDSENTTTNSVTVKNAIYDSFSTPISSKRLDAKIVNRATSSKHYLESSEKYSDQGNVASDKYENVLEGGRYENTALTNDYANPGVRQPVKRKEEEYVYVYAYPNVFIRK